MEKVPGIQLSEVWTQMKLVDKMNLRLDLARLQTTWLSVKFARYGGLYYSRDLQNISAENSVYRNESGAIIPIPHLQLVLLRVVIGST